MNVTERLQALKDDAKEQIKLVKSVHELNEAKSKYLGKKGVFADVMKLMRDLPNEEKPKFGK